MKPIFLTIAMLATLSIAFTAPAAQATSVTTYHLNVTVNGQTATILVPDHSGTGVITIPVGSQTLGQIKSAFGTTVFAFPGDYLGSFTFNGMTFAVKLSSADTFTIQFVQAQ